MNTKRIQFRLVALFGLVAIAAVVLAFARLVPQSFTPEELRELGSGKTRAEVRAVLGEPMRVEPGTPAFPREYWLYSGHRVVIVQFENDRSTLAFEP